MILPEPTEDLFSEFSMGPNGLFDYWARQLESAFLFLRAARRRELRGERRNDYDSDGLHGVSAAMGRADAAEVLMPDLAALWFVGGKTPRRTTPMGNGGVIPRITKVSLLREEAWIAAARDVHLELVRLHTGRLAA